MEMTSTAATSASNAYHFGRTATSASQVPRTTEAAIAVAVPQPTAESSGARPVFLRYVAAIATIRNISMPSRSVTSSIWPIGGSLGGQDQFSVLREPQAVLAAVMRDHEFAVGGSSVSLRTLFGVEVAAPDGFHLLALWR